MFVLEFGVFWKKVVFFENYCYYVFFILGIFISGLVVYYLVWFDMDIYVIVSFDVRFEEFIIIIVFLVDVRYFIFVFEMRVEFIEYGGKIIIFEYSYLKIEGMMVLWVLEDVEKKEWLMRNFVL